MAQSLSYLKKKYSEVGEKPTFWDTETTGLPGDPLTRIRQLKFSGSPVLDINPGLLVKDYRSVYERMPTDVRSQMPSPKDYKKFYKGKPTFEEAFPEILAKLPQSEPLVSFSGTDFDNNVVTSEIDRVIQNATGKKKEKWEGIKKTWGGYRQIDIAADAQSIFSEELRPVLDERFLLDNELLKIKGLPQKKENYYLGRQVDVGLGLMGAGHPRFADTGVFNNLHDANTDVGVLGRIYGALYDKVVGGSPISHGIDIPNTTSQSARIGDSIVARNTHGDNIMVPPSIKVSSGNNAIPESHQRWIEQINSSNLFRGYNVENPGAELNASWVEGSAGERIRISRNITDAKSGRAFRNDIVESVSLDFNALADSGLGPVVSLGLQEKQNGHGRKNLTEPSIIAHGLEITESGIDREGNPLFSGRIVSSTEKFTRSIIDAAENAQDNGRDWAGKFAQFAKMSNPQQGDTGTRVTSQSSPEVKQRLRETMPVNVKNVNSIHVGDALAWLGNRIYGAGQDMSEGWGILRKKAYLPGKDMEIKPNFGSVVENAQGQWNMNLEASNMYNKSVHIGAQAEARKMVRVPIGEGGRTKLMPLSPDRVTETNRDDFSEYAKGNAFIHGRQINGKRGWVEFSDLSHISGAQQNFYIPGRRGNIVSGLEKSVKMDMPDLSPIQLGGGVFGYSRRQQHVGFGEGMENAGSFTYNNEEGEKVRVPLQFHKGSDSMTMLGGKMSAYVPMYMNKDETGWQTTNENGGILTTESKWWLANKKRNDIAFIPSAIDKITATQQAFVEASIKERGAFGLKSGEEEQYTQRVRAGKNIRSKIDQLKTPGIASGMFNSITNSQQSNILNDWAAQMSGTSSQTGAERVALAVKNLQLGVAPTDKSELEDYKILAQGHEYLSGNLNGTNRNSERGPVPVDTENLAALYKKYDPNSTETGIDLMARIYQDVVMPNTVKTEEEAVVKLDRYGAGWMPTKSEHLGNMPKETYAINLEMGVRGIMEGDAKITREEAEKRYRETFSTKELDNGMLSVTEQNPNVFMAQLISPEVVLNSSSGGSIPNTMAQAISANGVQIDTSLSERQHLRGNMLKYYQTEKNRRNRGEDGKYNVHGDVLDLDAPENRDKQIAMRAMSAQEGLATEDFEAKAEEILGTKNKPNQIIKVGGNYVASPSAHLASKFTDVNGEVRDKSTRLHQQLFTALLNKDPDEKPLAATKRLSDSYFQEIGGQVEGIVDDLQRVDTPLALGGGFHPNSRLKPNEVWVPQEQRELLKSRLVNAENSPEYINELLGQDLPASATGYPQLSILEAGTTQATLISDSTLLSRYSPEEIKNMNALGGLANKKNIEVGTGLVNQQKRDYDVDQMALALNLTKNEDGKWVKQQVSPDTNADIYRKEVAGDATLSQSNAANATVQAYKNRFSSKYVNPLVKALSKSFSGSALGMWATAQSKNNPGSIIGQTYNVFNRLLQKLGFGAQEYTEGIDESEKGRSRLTAALNSARFGKQQGGRDSGKQFFGYSLDETYGGSSKAKVVNRITFGTEGTSTDIATGGIKAFMQKLAIHATQRHEKKGQPATAEVISNLFSRNKKEQEALHKDLMSLPSDKWGERILSHIDSFFTGGTSEEMKISGNRGIGDTMIMKKMLAVAQSKVENADENAMQGKSAQEIQEYNQEIEANKANLKTYTLAISGGDEEEANKKLEEAREEGVRFRLEKRELEKANLAELPISAYKNETETNAGRVLKELGEPTQAIDASPRDIVETTTKTAAPVKSATVQSQPNGSPIQNADQSILSPKTPLQVGENLDLSEPKGFTRNVRPSELDGSSDQSIIANLGAQWLLKKEGINVTNKQSEQGLESHSIIEAQLKSASANGRVQVNWAGKDGKVKKYWIDKEYIEKEIKSNPNKKLPQSGMLDLALFSSKSAENPEIIVDWKSNSNLKEGRYNQQVSYAQAVGAKRVQKVSHQDSSNAPDAQAIVDFMLGDSNEGDALLDNMRGRFGEEKTVTPEMVENAEFATEQIARRKADVSVEVIAQASENLKQAGSKVENNVLDSYPEQLRVANANLPQQGSPAGKSQAILDNDQARLDASGPNHNAILIDENGLPRKDQSIIPVQKKNDTRGKPGDIPQFDHRGRFNADGTENAPIGYIGAQETTAAHLAAIVEGNKLQGSQSPATEGATSATNPIVKQGFGVNLDTARRQIKEFTSAAPVVGEQVGNLIEDMRKTLAEFVPDASKMTKEDIVNFINNDATPRQRRRFYDKHGKAIEQGASLDRQRANAQKAIPSIGVGGLDQTEYEGFLKQIDDAANNPSVSNALYVGVNLKGGANASGKKHVNEGLEAGLQASREKDSVLYHAFGAGGLLDDTSVAGSDDWNAKVDNIPRSMFERLSTNARVVTKAKQDGVEVSPEQQGLFDLHETIKAWKPDALKKESSSVEDEHTAGFGKVQDEFIQKMDKMTSSIKGTTKEVEKHIETQIKLEKAMHDLVSTKDEQQKLIDDKKVEVKKNAQTGEVEITGEGASKYRSLEIERVNKQGVVSKAYNDEREAAAGLQPQEGENKLGQAFRGLFGGWGLMYAKAIGGYIVGGLGNDYEQNIKMRQQFSQSQYDILGTGKAPVDQNMALENIRAVNGANNNSLLGAQTLMAKNPLIGGALKTGVGGIAAGAYSLFALEELRLEKKMANGQMGVGGIPSNKIAMGIGAATIALNIAGVGYESLQDPASMGSRWARGASTIGDIAGAGWLGISGQWNGEKYNQIRSSANLSNYIQGGGTWQNYQANLKSAIYQWKQSQFAGEAQTQILANNPNWSQEVSGYMGAMATKYGWDTRIIGNGKQNALTSIAEDLQLGGKNMQAGSVFASMGNRSIAYGQQRLDVKTGGWESVVAPHEDVYGAMGSGGSWKNQGGDVYKPDKLKDGFREDGNEIVNDKTGERYLKQDDGTLRKWDPNKTSPMDIGQAYGAWLSQATQKNEGDAGYISKEEADRLQGVSGIIAGLTPKAAEKLGITAKTLEEFIPQIKKLDYMSAWTPQQSQQYQQYANDISSLSPSMMKRFESSSMYVSPENWGSLSDQGRYASTIAGQGYSDANQKWNQVVRQPINDATFFGDDKLSAYMSKLFSDLQDRGEGAPAMSLSRIIQGDPMAQTAWAMNGGNVGALQLPTLQGGKFDMSFMGQIGNTDIGMNGQMTGMKWGTTSFASKSIFGNRSAEQNATAMWGSNWQSSAAANDAVNGVALTHPIETPLGQITSVGGMTGMQWGHQDRQWGFQQEGFAMSQRSLDLSEAYTKQQWSFQDKGRDLANAFQEWQFGFQQRGLNMQSANFNENMGMQKKQATMQRTWAREDDVYNANVRDMQWGWKQSDFAEESRFMTGRTRRLAERQNERDTTMHNMETNQIDKQKQRQEEMWKLEDQRFSIQRKQFEESMKMQQESLNQNRKYFEERKNLEDAQRAAERSYYKEQMKMQREQLDLQIRQAEEQRDYEIKAREAQLAMEAAQAAQGTLSDGWQTLMDGFITSTDNGKASLEAFIAQISSLTSILDSSGIGGGGGGGGGGSCFTGNMNVTMGDGTKKNIKDVKVGDLVLSNFNGKNISTTVDFLIVHVSGEAPEVVIINNSIYSTPEHRFFVNGEWIRVIDMRIGDRLLKSDGSKVTITSLVVVSIEEPVYNLHLNHESHNYYVEDVLVHNTKTMALGGTILAGTRAWVGENGPEMFIADTNGKIIPNHRVGSNNANYSDDYVSNTYFSPPSGFAPQQTQQINVYIGNEKIKSFVLDAIQKELSS